MERVWAFGFVSGDPQTSADRCLLRSNQNQRGIHEDIERASTVVDKPSGVSFFFPFFKYCIAGKILYIKKKNCSSVIVYENFIGGEQGSPTAVTNPRHSQSLRKEEADVRMHWRFTNAFYVFWHCTFYHLFVWYSYAFDHLLNGFLPVKLGNVSASLKNDIFTKNVIPVGFFSFFFDTWNALFVSFKWWCTYEAIYWYFIKVMVPVTNASAPPLIRVC